MSNRIYVQPVVLRGGDNGSRFAAFRPTSYLLFEDPIDGADTFAVNVKLVQDSGRVEIERDNWPVPSVPSGANYCFLHTKEGLLACAYAFLTQVIEEGEYEDKEGPQWAQYRRDTLEALRDAVNPGYLYMLDREKWRQVGGDFGDAVTFGGVFYSDEENLILYHFGMDWDGADEKAIPEYAFEPITESDIAPEGWIDREAVENASGRPMDLSTPDGRVQATLDARDYYGIENFDSYPRSFTQYELEARYSAVNNHNPIVVT